MAACGGRRRPLPRLRNSMRRAILQPRCALQLLVMTGAVLMNLPAAAQLGEATPEEAKIGRPSPNTPVTDTTPPPADPRDFSGQWRNPPRGAAPGGAAGGVGAAPAATAPAAAPGAAGIGAASTGSERTGNAYRASSRYCIPGTMVLSGGEAGTLIVQTADELRVLTEEQHNNRRIYINQQHTVPPVRSVNGDSIAHWEGNTLVVETVGFLGYGVSPTLVRNERISKSADGRTLTDEVSYQDASGRATPAATPARLVWAPGTRVLEYICEDGSDAYMSKDYQ